MGVDVMRWLYLRTAAGEQPQLRLRRRRRDQARLPHARSGTRTRFFVTYASIDGWTRTRHPATAPAGEPSARPSSTAGSLSELNQLVSDVTDGAGGLRLDGGCARDRGLRRGAVELVRAPQPPPLLEVGRRLGQARRLRDAVDLPDDAQPPARAVHARSWPKRCTRTSSAAGTPLTRRPESVHLDRLAGGGRSR